jgi:CMP/dCMP kinase
MIESDTYVVALDGISGSGKSSTARQVARELGILHLDTGAMYRSVTWEALKADLRPEQAEAVAEVAKSLHFSFDNHDHLIVNGHAPGPEIRSAEVSSMVSDFCQIPEVRRALVAAQRYLGTLRSCVVEGRDIGTVVFPKARFKFFMTARPEVRAKRRHGEMLAMGLNSDLADILRNLQERDGKDTSREESPLIKADDAIEIDTSDLTFDQQVAKIAHLVRQALVHAS